MVEKLPRIGPLPYVNLHKKCSSKHVPNQLTSIFLSPSSWLADILSAKIVPSLFYLLNGKPYYIHLWTYLSGILNAILSCWHRRCDSEIVSDLVVHDLVLLCHSTWTWTCICTWMICLLAASVMTTHVDSLVELNRLDEKVAFSMEEHTLFLYNDTS